MSEFVKRLLELKCDRRGINMIEYAIMGSIIAAALVLAVPVLTAGVTTGFNTMASNVTKA